VVVEAGFRLSVNELTDTSTFRKTIFAKPQFFLGSTQHSIVPDCIANMPVPEINLNPSLHTFYGGANLAN
jgi:hypothetical protein